MQLTIPQLIIPIDAIPQQRPRVTNGIVYDPPKCKKFKQDFSFLLKSLYRDNPLNGALNAQIDIFRNFKNPTQKRYGDADNLAKPILDAANLILWLDDSQIVDLHVRKFIVESNPFVKLDFRKTIPYFGDYL